jgi:hypothetical protein
MNRGGILGLIITLLLLAIAYISSQLIPAFGSTAEFLTALMLMAAGAILFYTNSTTEGSVWIRKSIGRENVGIAVFIESGKFMKPVTCDYSKDSIEYSGQSYRIKKEFIIYRMGIPYLYFIVGIGENIDPLNLDQMKALGDNKVVTAWMFQSMALWRALAFNQIQNRLWIALIVLGVVMVAGFAFLYWGGVSPTQDAVNRIGNFLVTHLATPSPSVGAIPVV